MTVSPNDGLVPDDGTPDYRSIPNDSIVPDVRALDRNVSPDLAPPSENRVAHHTPISNTGIPPDYRPPLHHRASRQIDPFFFIDIPSLKPERVPSQQITVRHQRVGPPTHHISTHRIIRPQTSHACRIVVPHDMRMYSLAVQLVILQHPEQEALPHSLIVEIIRPQAQNVGGTDVDIAVDQVLSDLDLLMRRQDLRIHIHIASLTGSHLLVMQTPLLGGIQDEDRSRSPGFRSVLRPGFS